MTKWFTKMAVDMNDRNCAKREREKMFITIQQTIECSKCGSHKYESFFDATYTGTRCKDCGHEKKDLHPHLKETTSTGSVSRRGGHDVIKF